MKLTKCNHNWVEIDRVPCWHHPGDGCEEVMWECSTCGEYKETHAYPKRKGGEE